MKNNYMFNKMVSKILDYTGNDLNILNVKNSIVDYYKTLDNSETNLVTDSKDIEKYAEPVAINSLGRTFFGSSKVEHVNTEDGIRPYVIHTIPFRTVGGMKGITMDINEELKIVKGDITEDEKIQMADSLAKREILCNPRHYVSVPYSTIKEFLKVTRPESVGLLDANAYAYTPAFVGGNSIEESEGVFVDMNDNFIIENMKDGNESELRLVTYHADNKIAEVVTFNITEHCKVSKSGTRTYPVNSVYNDPELMHKVAIHEGVRAVGRDMNRKVGTLARKTLTVPVKTMRKLADADKRMRGAISKMRKAREQRYKEQILHDEVMPVADGMFRTFIGLVTTMGLGVVAGPAGVLFGAALSFLINSILKANFKNKKEICLKILDDQIAQAESEVEDAKSENDLETKRALEQVIRELKRKRRTIKYKDKLGTRG